MRGGIRRTLLISYVLITSILLTRPGGITDGLEDYTGDHTDAYVTTSGSLSLNQPDEALFTLDPYYDGEWRYFRLEGLIGRFNGSSNSSLHLSIENKGEQTGFIDTRATVDYESDGALEVIIDFPRYEINVNNGSRIDIDLFPEMISGEFGNITGGVIHLMIRQEAKPNFMPAIHIGAGSYLRLPIDRDFLIADAGDDQVTRAGIKVKLIGDAYNPFDRELTYRWDLDLSDGLEWEAEGYSIEHVYTGEGRYIATLNVSDGTQYSHDQVAVSVFPSSPPVAAPGGDRTVYRNDTIRLDASGSFDPDGDPLTFKWILPDGAVESRIQITLRLPEPGIFGIILSVNDGYFTTNATVNITVKNRPPVVLNIDYGIPRIGHPMTFNASMISDPEGDPLVGYYWDFGDGTTGEGRTVNHTYLESRYFRVKLNVSDGYENGSGYVDFWIPENEGPTAVAKDDFIHTCVGKNAYFFSYDSTDPDNHALNYTWDFGDGATGYGFFAKHIYDAEGTYNATLIVRDNVGNESGDELVVYVHDRGRYYPDEVRIASVFTGTFGVLPSVEYFLLYYDHHSDQTFKVYREEEGFRTFKIDLPAGSWYEVRFRTLEGANVDVLLMTPDQYDDYLTNHGDAVEWLNYGSSLGEDDFTFHVEGGKVLYIVIDNNNKIPRGASPQGNVLFSLAVSETDHDPSRDGADGEASVEESSDYGDTCLCSFISIFILVIILIIIYYGVKSVRGEQREYRERRRRDIVIRDLKAGRVKTIPRDPPDQKRRMENIPEKKIELDPVSVGISYNRVEGTYNNLRGRRFSTGISISDGDKDRAPSRINDESDFLGSTDVKALVYNDEEFDLKQTDEWKRTHPLDKTSDPQSGDKSKGSDDDSGPRLAPPPPEW
ncbi:MAG: PKD domain-containing protein [Thermoplasmatota archaeon]